jgi:hypothetical protein
MKGIKIERCGECDVYFKKEIEQVGFVSKGGVYYPEPLKNFCIDLQCEVDPETIDENCPLDDWPEPCDAIMAFCKLCGVCRPDAK